MKEGYHLANKIRKPHLNYSQNKMNVGYAAKMLSRSVAKSILVCCDLGFPGFEGAEVTADFLQCFDKNFES